MVSARVHIVKCLTRQIKGHFRDKSFEAINFAGTHKICNKMPQYKCSNAASTGTDAN